MAVSIMPGMLVPAAGNRRARQAGGHHRPGRRRRPEHRHADGTRGPERGGDHVHVRVATTRIYDAGPEPAGERRQGQPPRPVTADIGGLAPATTYHYRLVARNAKGVTRGAGSTFRTKRQPLGSRSPRRRTGPAGRGDDDRRHAVGHRQRRPAGEAAGHPFRTRGFQDASDVHLTSSDGNSRSWSMLRSTRSTAWRCRTSRRSRAHRVGWRGSEGRRVRRARRRTPHGAIFRFSGRIIPAHDGTQIAIERLKGTRW